jgi:elongation factor G
MLYAAGAIERQGSVQAGATVGDASPEARGRGQTVEMNIASFSFMDDRYGVIDLPGSPEFVQEADFALPAVDLAIVVAEADPDKAVLLQPILQELDRLNIPRILFVNKIDQAKGRLRDLLEALQAVSAHPLVARQIPIWETDKVTGYVDLALERAYVYRPGQASERIDIPKDVMEREKEARFQMLEKLADYDDALMEQLLSDVTPTPEAVFADLTRETAQNLITPVMLGAAFFGHGVRRLLKALRHETPEPSAAATRLGLDGTCAYVMKSSHAGQAGKLSLARIMGGKISDGAELTLSNGDTGRIGGVFSMLGAASKKIPAAEAGELVALAKVEAAKAGQAASPDGKARAPLLDALERPAVFAFAIRTTDRKDDVRLSSAIAKLMEEDHALTYAHDPDTHETVLSGQGEIHLRITLERLKRRYNVAVEHARPRAAYHETVRKGATMRGRHKKQSGGHGQFGDVVIETAPLARGSGVTFGDRITGGVVPKQWIPAVEMGVRDACERGPLGFPVVDVGVTLTDGSYHAVDSSEIAFRTAGRMAMIDALRAGEPLLLEPVDHVSIVAPNSATSRITSMLSSRRGQILGFDAREGWPGWDRIEAYLPRSERMDLIVELRALTQGLGGYEAKFAHMAELNGKLAEEIVAAQARMAMAG